MVSGPTLPKNIAKMMSNCPPVERPGVTPVEFPLVPKAEMVSKINSMGLPSSTTSSKKHNATTTRTPIIARVAAYSTCRSGIWRSKISARFRPRTVERAETSSTPSVFTLMPPAVEPEAPPMNIIAISISHV